MAASGYYRRKQWESKQPILEWDKTAEFENGKKSAVLKTGQNP